MGLASLLNLGLIALNRYVKVVKQALYTKFFPSKRVAWLYSGFVWLVSLLLATPPLYGWGKMNFDSDSFICVFNWRNENVSFLILHPGVFNVTTCAIIYSYWKIYRTVKESTDVNANVVKMASVHKGFIALTSMF